MLALQEEAYEVHNRMKEFSRLSGANFGAIRNDTTCWWGDYWGDVAPRMAAADSAVFEAREALQAIE